MNNLDLDYLKDNGKYMIDPMLADVNGVHNIELFDDTDKTTKSDTAAAAAAAAANIPGAVLKPTDNSSSATTCPTACPAGPAGKDGSAGLQGQPGPKGDPGVKGDDGQDFTLDTKHKIILAVILLILLFNTGCSLAFLLR